MNGSHESLNYIQILIFLFFRLTEDASAGILQFINIKLFSGKKKYIFFFFAFFLPFFKITELSLNPIFRLTPTLSATDKEKKMISPFYIAVSRVLGFIVSGPERGTSTGSGLRPEPEPRPSGQFHPEEQ